MSPVGCTAPCAAFHAPKPCAVSAFSALPVSACAACQQRSETPARAAATARCAMLRCQHVLPSQGCAGTAAQGTPHASPATRPCPPCLAAGTILAMQDPRPWTLQPSSGQCWQPASACPPRRRSWQLSLPDCERGVHMHAWAAQRRTCAGHGARQPGADDACEGGGSQDRPDTKLQQNLVAA